MENLENKVNETVENVTNATEEKTSGLFGKLKDVFDSVVDKVEDVVEQLKENETVGNIIKKGEELINKTSTEAFSAADAILIHCVEAIHINQEGDESCPYTWEVPQGMKIEVGDTLIVESHVGFQYTVVVATTEPYPIQRYTGVDSDTHPYCAVVHNCGKLSVFPKSSLAEQKRRRAKGFLS